jgi:hypothetical protein
LQYIEKLWNDIFIHSPVMFSRLLRGHFHDEDISKIPAVVSIINTADPGVNRRIFGRTSKAMDQKT